MRWLRGIKKRVFKKHKRHVNIDGVYYTPESYSEMIEEANKLRVGDLIYNPYKDIKEPIKEIQKRWEKHWPSINMGFRKVRYLEIIFITESGCIIYDINDEKWCRLAKESNREL